MSEFSFRRNPRRRVSINLTSLIDVLFLLLIFFMLTSTFRRAGEMELELATSSTAAASEATPENAPLEVAMLRDGTVRFGGQVVADDEELLRVLSAAHEADAGRGILLNAEAEARHADVVRLIDIVREAGYGGLSLGTEIVPRGSRGSSP
ncbi:biopolymer transporter ExbD [bacterium]|nr:MAG: biopolymer transporter ExbD [bacterium]